MATLSPAALGAQTDPPQRLAISHVAQLDSAVPTLRLYLDVETDGGSFLSAIAPGALTGTLGESSLQVGPSRPFTGTDEGVAYLFLLDVSASLSLEQFDEIRQAIDAWISSLGRNDRAALLAFGERSELVVDLTRDVAALRAGLQSLGPTDRLTLLHQALADALTLSQRQDEDLPARRVIVLLSDGRDEGSGLALDDVLQRLRAQPMPIYAIGHSQFGEPQRSRDLNVLRRLASNSGGAFFEADRTAFAESYAWISRAIDRVMVVDAACAACPADGRSYRLQLRLDQDGRVLSEGTDVRLLPVAVPEPTPQQPTATEPTATAVTPEPQIPAEEPSGRSWFWPTLLAVAALLGVALFVLGRRGRAPAEIDVTPPADPAPAAPPSGEMPAQAAASAPMAGAGSRIRGSGLPAGRLAPTPESLPRVKLRPRSDTDSGDDVPLDPERPQRRRVVRFVVVRGANKGREYRTVLRARAVVGSRSTCDCVLAGEENVGSEQFELIQRSDQVYLQNLDEHRPTLLNGLTLKGRETLKSGDLVGTQDTILRVLLDG